MVRDCREGTCSLTKYCPIEEVTLKLHLDILTGSKGERAFKADKKKLLVESYETASFKVKTS